MQATGQAGGTGPAAAAPTGSSSTAALLGSLGSGSNLTAMAAQRISSVADAVAAAMSTGLLAAPTSSASSSLLGTAGLGGGSGATSAAVLLSLDGWRPKGVLVRGGRTMGLDGPRGMLVLVFVGGRGRGSSAYESACLRVSMWVGPC